MRFLCVLLLSAWGTLAGVAPAQAGSPAETLDARLLALLGTEGKALGAVSEGRLSELASPPPVRTGETGDFRYDGAWLSSLPKAEGDADWRCLSEALYFEARGETIRGQFAVAEVIMNRVDSAEYPDTLCGVINQGTGRKYQCQFTSTCDGRKEVIAEPRAWTRVGKVAKLIMDGTAPRGLTRGATHYHTTAVRPRWARVFPKTATIGVHHFYRQPTRLSSN